MIAETTLRIELLKFYDNLYHDDTGLRDPSGWKCHFAKNYIQSIKMKDIIWFVGTTLKKMKVDSSYLTKEKIQFIAKQIYFNYKYTIDDEYIAFVIKSKTEMNRNDDKRFWMIRMFSYIGKTLKNKYNNTLEILKI